MHLFCILQQRENQIQFLFRTQSIDLSCSALSRGSFNLFITKLKLKNVTSFVLISHCLFRLSSLHRSLGNAQSGQSGPRDPSKPRSRGAFEFFFVYFKKKLCRNIKIKSVFMVSAKIHQEVSQREWVVPNSHHKQVSWQNDKQFIYFMFGNNHACMTKPWIIQVSNFQCIQMWSGRRG